MHCRQTWYDPSVAGCSVNKSWRSCTSMSIPVREHQYPLVNKHFANWKPWPSRNSWFTHKNSMVMFSHGFPMVFLLKMVMFHVFFVCLPGRVTWPIHRHLRLKVVFPVGTPTSSDEQVLSNISPSQGYVTWNHTQNGLLSNGMSFKWVSISCFSYVIIYNNIQSYLIIYNHIQ